MLKRIIAEKMSVRTLEEEIRKIITSLKEKISGKTTKIFNKEKGEN